MPRPTDTLARRTAAARKHRGMSQDQLAAASGMKQPDISKIERGLILKTTGIARIADALRVPHAWLELGEGDEPEWGSSSPSTRGVHRQPTLVETTVSPPTLAWEELTTVRFPEAFALVLRDDAMSPTYPPGGTVRFAKGRPPVPGRPVLLTDRAGDFYVREYRARTATHWIAAALNPAYASLDSESDGLLVIAVMTGWDWPQE